MESNAERQPLPETAPRIAPTAAPSFAFSVTAGRAARYDVVVEPGLLASFGRRFVDAVGRRMVVVLTDRRVDRLFGAHLRRSFADVGIEPHVIAIPDGERSKSMRMFATLLEKLAALSFDRRAVLVNFGGGVICDLGGFVASAYMRGVSYVNFATSLIAQVDAAIGGKVAVNTAHAKNMIGAFHHPSFVAADPALLASLSARDIRSGIAEAIKIGIIASPEYFALLERESTRIRNRDPHVLTGVIGQAAKIKMDLITPDPYETDLRRPLNFGHTIGHPIETEFGYRNIRHGEAVGLGMGIATMLAVKRGIVSRPDADRILAILQRYDLLGFSEPIRPDSVIAHMRYVRLIRGNALNFVLPTGIGSVAIVDDLSEPELAAGFDEYAQAVRDRTGP